MNIAPMNKTAIINFLDLDAVLKLRNISQSMRNRVSWIIKDKTVKVSEYNPKVLSLCRRVYVLSSLPSKNSANLKKGVANYPLHSQEDADKLLSLNGEIRCGSLEFIPTTPIQVDCVEYLEIRESNITNFDNVSFKKIELLEFEDVSANKIQTFLEKVESIEFLQISEKRSDKKTIENKTFSKRVDLSKRQIKMLSLVDLNLCESFILPKHLEELQVYSVANTALIECGTIEKMYITPPSDSLLGNRISAEEGKWLKSMKRLKEIYINQKCVEDAIKYLPSSLRYLRTGYFDFYDFSEELKKTNLPFLITAPGKIDIEVANRSQIKILCPIASDSHGSVSIRPRKITISMNNYSYFNKHPEVLEKVEKVAFETDDFNLDFLPSKIRHARFSYINKVKSGFLKEFEENSWKFEEAVINLKTNIEVARIILKNLKKAKKVTLSKEIKDTLLEEFDLPFIERSSTLFYCLPLFE